VACKRERSRIHRVANQAKVNEQQRARNAINQDKVRAYQRAWLAANKAKVNEQQRARRAANLDAHRAWQCAHYARDPKKRCAQTRDWQRAHPEWARAWRKANPTIFRVHAKLGGARKRRATPPGADKVMMHAFAREAVFLTRLSGTPWHLDHVIPIKGETVSGLNTHLNLEVIPGAANLAKKNRFDPADAFRPLAPPIPIVKHIPPATVEVHV
jgi:hypothetical protein